MTLLSMRHHSPLTPLAAMGLRLRALPNEHRIAIAGVMLVPLMVVMLSIVLMDNMARADQKRLTQEAYDQQRRACRAMPTRLAREQCMIDLGPSPAILAQH